MNYIEIEGVKIELTAKQVKKLKEELKICNAKRLSEIAVGDTFTLGDYEFIVLEQSGDTTAVILKELFKNGEKFSESDNKYYGSNVDNICNEFAMEMKEIVGKENLVEHTVDLTADDGLKCYGSIKRKMSLLTAEQYRKYVYIMDKHKIDKWWWLATAHSTSKHDNSSWVKCVSPDGFMDDFIYYDINGVRPFCILKSNIFVSK